MEAIERYSGIFQGDEIRVTRRFTDFPAGDAIPPNDVMLFSDAQYRRDQAPTTGPDEAPAIWRHSIHRPRSNGRRSGRCATNASNICRPACCIFSTRALPPNRSTRIPTAARPATRSRKRSSRDSSNWWSGIHTQSGGTIDSQRAEVDLGQFDDSYVRDLQIQLAETGRRLWVLDITSDLGIPSFVAMSHSDGKRAGKHRVRFRLALRSRESPCCAR